MFPEAYAAGGGGSGSQQAPAPPQPQAQREAQAAGAARPPRRCTACGRADGEGGAKLLRCSGCRRVFFCGQACQTEARHNKAECRRAQQEAQEQLPP